MTIDKILVGFDGSDQAKDALVLAQLMARDSGASLTIAAVFAHELPSVAGWDEFEQGMRAEAEQTLEQARSQLDRSIDAHTVAIAATSDARGLLQAAEDNNVDLIVLGSCHRGTIGRTFVGSAAQSVLHGASSPVLVAPRGFASAARSPRVIGVGFDGSPESRRALELAGALAAQLSGTVRAIGVVHVKVTGGYPVVTPGYDYGALERGLRDELQDDLNSALEALPESVRAAGTILTGDPAEQIAAECEKGIDLLIVGSRGYGPLRVVLLGSISNALMRSAPCPVMVVPRSA